MMRSISQLFVVLVFIGPAHADRPPNVVFIVADDLGLECVQAYGGLSYRTPNIDRLAAEGMRFSHCFSNPYCSPSRAQLLTGRYPMHNGITRVIYDPQRHREFLDPAKESSFAKLMQQAGYATAIAGKWQVSFLHERDTIRDHGFDAYQCWQIFHEGEKTSRYANPTFRRNGEVLSDELHGKYGPDVNVEFLIDFMKQHRDRPFLVYYTSLLPHWPWEPTPDSGEPIKPASGKGDVKYMDDMVAYLDRLVGRLVAAVDALGLTDKTIFIFTGDNGTDQRITSKWTDGQTTRMVKGGKGTMTDAGTRVPLIVKWPGVVEAGTVCDDFVDFSDMLPTLVEIAGAPASPQPIDGRSFVGHLRGKAVNPRQWVHVQDKSERYVRNEDFILTDRGAFRPTVEIGHRPAKPLQGALTPQQRSARAMLTQALEAAAK